MSGMTEFQIARNVAITAAVERDEWGPARLYCRKYGVPMPKDEKVFKAGIYKAAQECTDISAEVKAKAAEKCIALGFRPRIG